MSEYGIFEPLFEFKNMGEYETEKGFRKFEKRIRNNKLDARNDRKFDSISDERLANMQLTSLHPDRTSPKFKEKCSNVVYDSDKFDLEDISDQARDLFMAIDATDRHDRRKNKKVNKVNNEFSINFV